MVERNYLTRNIGEKDGSGLNTLKQNPFAISVLTWSQNWWKAISACNSERCCQSRKKTGFIFTCQWSAGLSRPSLLRDLLKAGTWSLSAPVGYKDVDT